MKKTSITITLKNDDSNNDATVRRRKHTVVRLNETEITIWRNSKDIAVYCLPLVAATFNGQTTSTSRQTDQWEDALEGNLHLGVYLQVMDEYLRSFNEVTDFTGEEDYYHRLLSYIAKKRKMAGESDEETFERLLMDSRRFVKIYHRRGIVSQELKDHKNYWGSRQQLLSAKLIADWLDPDNGPLDPIFGALLQPTTGRAGPGDSGWMHQLLFDGCGYVAYHSAVHDAFGYLHNFHNIGPGYDYLDQSKLKKNNPLAGQVDGMSFWRRVVRKIQMKHNLMDLSSPTVELCQLFHPEARRNTTVY